MSTRERWVLRAVAGLAVVLIAVRTVRAGSPDTWVDAALAGAGFAVAVAAFVRGVVRWFRHDGGFGRLERAWAHAARGMTRKRRRAMVRALRGGEPIPAEEHEPARRYAAMRATHDVGAWTAAALAVMQGAAGGGRYDVLPSWLRLLFVVLLALAAVLLVHSAGRWQRVLAGFDTAHAGSP